MRQAGYLLIEMVISLAIVAIMSLILALMHAAMIDRHRQAAMHATATTIAASTLALLQHKKTALPEYKDFTVTVESLQIDQSIPYMLHTVIVSFKTSQSTERKVVITGGAFDAPS